MKDAIGITELSRTEKWLNEAQIIYCSLTLIVSKKACDFSFMAQNELVRKSFNTLIFQEKDQIKLDTRQTSSKQSKP